MQVAEKSLKTNLQASGSLDKLRQDFGDRILAEQHTCDSIPTVWVERQDIKAVL